MKHAFFSVKDAAYKAASPMGAKRFPLVGP